MTRFRHKPTSWRFFYCKRRRVLIGGNERAQGSGSAGCSQLFQTTCALTASKKAEMESFDQRVQASDCVRRATGGRAECLLRRSQRFSRRTLAACDKRFFIAPTIGKRFLPLVSPAADVDMDALAEVSRALRDTNVDRRLAFARMIELVPVHNYFRLQFCSKSRSGMKLA